ncbi:MAG: caspase family protein [Saprospiraceae bacterium]
MSRFISIVFIAVIFYSSADAQVRKPKSYALVIGISEYKDKNITSLNFAHRDAEYFANLCTSASGLNIPQAQVKLLVNEDASYWNLVDGLDWLKSVAQKDDNVYFYFAGHGDMESLELQFGYLLAHDSRYMNYLGRSLSLDILNKTAHTLSVTKKAKVFLITDACHSGKLAGVDFNGSNLTTLKLMQIVSNNEVRITSCNEGELSYEDEVWGSGRGAFSYFLGKGMSGEADGVNGSKDGNITIAEIKSYISGKVPNEVKEKKQKKQNPVIMGTESAVLNSFKATASSDLESMPMTTSAQPTSTSGSRSVGRSTEAPSLTEDITHEVDHKISFERVDVKSLADKDKKTIVKLLLNDLFDTKVYPDKLLNSQETSQQLAKAMYDRVQEVIDLYLSGDEAELEKRRYYSDVKSPYDDFPYMIDIAIKLLEPDHSLIPTLKMQKEYLSGLSYRLKIPFSSMPDTLIEKALVHQKKALELESNAAFIHNELGILHMYIKDQDKAKFHYEKAMMIAPLWSLPYSNMANLYYTKDDLDSSRTYVNLAIDKQQDLQNPYVTDGSIFMKQDNLLFAEEQLQHAIKLNSRHYLPFEKLGELYLRTQDFFESDDYYYEAELRKMGLEFPQHFMDVLDASVQEPMFPPCTIDTTDVAENDIMTQFAIGIIYFDNRDFVTAQRWFDKVVRVDIENPLVYHYLGQTAYYFKKYDKAEFYFKLAIENFLSDSLFLVHMRAISNDFSRNACAWENYEKSYFDFYMPNIYLARTYEKWGNFITAIDRYNECINIDPNNSTAYAMLWKLYMDRRELESVENTIYRFGKYFPESLDAELAAFYQRVLDSYPDDLQKIERYAYKYGLLMHQFMLADPFNDFGESLMPEPDKEEKDFDFNQSRMNSITFFESEEGTLISDVHHSEANTIAKPLSMGVKMFRKVVSISIDKDITADAYAKIGDIYIRAKSVRRALENYENSLKIKDDDIGIRSKAIDCADQLYLFKKSLDHLVILEQSNGLGFEDMQLLANYYMRSGDSTKTMKLYNEITIVHPYLREEVSLDIIKTQLRFGNYQRAIDLLTEYLKNNQYDNTLHYMLARAHANLSHEKEAWHFILTAQSKGFNLGFVYKNDPAFDKYRGQPDWKTISEVMNGHMKARMESSPDK